MFDTLKQRAKASVRTKRAACTGFALMYMALFPVIDFAVYNLLILFRRYSSLIICGEYIAVIVLNACLSLGACLFFLGLSKRKDVDFITLFDGFENLFRAVGLVVIILVFTFLWALLLIIPGIVALYRYRMAFYILAESPEISPIDAIRISKNMMIGKKFRLFLLDLSFIGWYLLTFVTFGIAGLYVLPYRFAADTEFYREIKAEYVENINYEKKGQEKSRENQSYRSNEERENHTWNTEK